MTPRTDGYDHGASDAYDVELDHAMARRFLNGVQADPEELMPRSPLSGEWAGESIPELIDGARDMDPDDLDDACQAYEQGYYAGWEDTLTERCSEML